jgi:hypothetical protein
LSSLAGRFPGGRFLSDLVWSFTGVENRLNSCDVVYGAPLNLKCPLA